MGRRDPFFTNIVRELGRLSLDSAMFECLAAELVRSHHFATNVVSGGADCGYDFELLFKDGEPGPGLVTTGVHVLDNLKRNLKKNVATYPNATKKTYVVTSQSLTPRRRRHLYEAANELGFVLLGVSDRDSVAEYIYRNPHWARELLQLTGSPSALSPIPNSSRPLVRLSLVGRSDALDTIERATGDVILIGAPGSGKTALLTHLADTEKGLFLVDDANSGNVADAIRELSPQRVFIDDAVDTISTVRGILRLRNEIGADFSIVVTGWRRSHQLEQLLPHEQNAVFELEQLTRDEIVEVVREAGICGPIPLVREIVNQADGVPGLAVALVQSAVGGDVASLLHGDLLGSLMSATVERLLGDQVDGQKAIPILAVLSLAGDAGLTIAEAAEGLNHSATEMQALIRRLEPGGVVKPTGDRISVRPRALRRYLIREVFFSDAPLDYQPWLRAVPDFASSVRELAWAARAGAGIPRLIDHVVESGDTEAARIFAGSGSVQTSQLLATQPRLAVPVAREALHTAPEVVLPLLLDAAVGDGRALHSNPDHPLRIVQDWLHGGLPGTGDALRRRRLVVRAAVSWAKSSSSPAICVQVCCDAIAPMFRATETDPGSGMKLTWSQGTLMAAEVDSLVSLWESVVPTLAGFASLPWPLLLSACHQAAFPALGSGLRPDVGEATKILARHMVDDLSGLAADYPGVLDRLNALLQSIGEVERFSIPEDYAILYGDIDRHDWKRDQERRSSAIDRMVGLWADEPSRSARRLALLQSEAARVESHMSYSGLLCARLAAEVTRPGEWLAALTSEGVDPTCVEPFLERVIAEDIEAADNALGALMDTPANDAAISVALKIPNISDALWSRLAVQFDRCCGYVEILALRDQIPEKNLRRLLCHQSDSVRAAVAEGMWQGQSHGIIPPSLLDPWRAAVTDCLSTSYWLREMLLTDPRLAEQWLRRRVESDDWRALAEEANVYAAVSVIPTDDCVAILRDLREHILDPELVRAVVGDSTDVFSALLRDESLSDLADAPLHRPADDTWRSFVLVASTLGVDATRIAASSVFRWGVHVGPESAYLQGLINEYEPWLNDKEGTVAAVARTAAEILTLGLAAALKDERRRAVEGWD